MAVKTVKGRHRSDRSTEEELENLDPDEREVLQLMFSEAMSSRGVGVVRNYRMADGTEITDGGQPLFDLIAETEYSREVVSLEEWIGDSHFMGKVGFSWPKWRADLSDLFSGGYHEAVLTGA